MRSVDRTVADPMIGRVLDRRYRVGPRIARGGMATVYEATDLRLDRLCALKVMHAGLGDDDDFAGRFVREARSAARLSHPHVVGVYDQGDDDGTLFLAMEHVPGHTLRDVIRTEAPMAPARALALVDPVLSALAAAHAAGLIHRDVKPENVLLSDDGRVKVADFGLARAINAETQHTATGGVLIGTVSYLSPELVVDGTADARSDVYAAGVVLYELLTGRKPHEGDSPIQVAYKHVHEDVPAPSGVVPGLPPYVDALVARATARDRELRPADARVLLHQVRRVRAALDHGVVDDPDLVADLSPTVPVQRRREDEFIDYVRDDVPTILTPAQAARAAEAEQAAQAAQADRAEHVDRADRADGDRDGTDHTSRIHRDAGPVALAASPPMPARRPAGPPQRPVPTPRRSRRGPVLLVLVLLLAVAAGVGGWWFGSGRYVSTPGVINLTRAAAAQKADAAGLGFRVTGKAYSETIPVGRVVRTDPAGGERIVREGTLGAVLSRGPERHDVPALRGMSLDAAQDALRQQSLSFGRATYAFSPTVARGVVLSADPKPGTSLRPDTAVDLVVSKGPRPVDVTDWTGKDADDARSALGEDGFDVDVTEENSDTVEKGTVISQDPRGGTLFKGDRVGLVVSEGPVLVDVPKVTGMGIAEAEQRLRDAGFAVEKQQTELYVGLEYVVKQSPGGSDQAPRGSTVTVFVV